MSNPAPKSLTPRASSLFLIGYRATGKTSVARCLARRLGWDWVDADVDVELRAAKSIAAIFADDGEPAFRDLEQLVVTNLVQRQRTIIALGGGAVLREANREALSCKTVVWLMATPATIAQRMAADPVSASQRPNLTNLAREAEIVQLLTQREPLYRQSATISVDTEGKSPDEIADEIIARLGVNLNATGMT